MMHLARQEKYTTESQPPLSLVCIEAFDYLGDFLVLLIPEPGWVQPTQWLQEQQSHSKE